jgi:CRISPR-associated endonuclease/helicase Cas3
LTEQTKRTITKCFARLGLNTRVYSLLGGAVDHQWDIRPEEESVIIGTQDILLSAALNRAYAISRYRWPILFGLLNNDCLWVMDEVQLMGPGLASTIQLAAFRERFGVFGRCPSIWMSATIDPENLRSIDFPSVPPLIELSDEDKRDKRLSLRLNAKKELRLAPDSCRDPKNLAAFVRTKHVAGTQTLVVVNRVSRARDCFDALRRAYINDNNAPDIRLMHSHFRGHERRAWLDMLAGPVPTNGRIIVATQVIEAGVDITAKLLVTDLAPYSSMVQRFGRCNRDGKETDACIYWINDASHLGPYDPADLQAAAAILSTIHSAAPQDLPSAQFRHTEGHVLRKRDLIDLFDTTRDLSGYDVDVSRFVRSEQDHDVFVAWRHMGPGGPADGRQRPDHDELCPVPIGEFKKFLGGGKTKRQPAAWEWKSREGAWKRVAAADLRPGLIVLLDVAAGGYDPELGWSADLETAVEAVPSGSAEQFESMSDDPLSEGDYNQALLPHLREVRDATEEILQRLPGIGVELYQRELLQAAAGHDFGKAHPVFQKTMHALYDGPELLAKSKARGQHSRKHFRHELASALALLAAGADDLVAYLAACHHGKVRLSIRAVPGEGKPEEPNARFARGIHQGDRLPAVDTHLGVAVPETVLDLEQMLLGGNGRGPSWLARMVELRDRIGVFRLAFLEALIRAADARATISPKEVL